MQHLLEPIAAMDISSHGKLDAVLRQVLCQACQAGHTEIVEHLLMRFELDLNSLDKLEGEEGMPLHFAIRSNSEPIMRLLLSRTQRIDQPDGDRRTCLHLAVLHSANPSHIRMHLRLLCFGTPLF